MDTRAPPAAPGRLRRYLPLAGLLSWLLFTVALFELGPYPYARVGNRPLLYLYLAAVHGALWLGYWRGSRSQGRGVRGRVPVLAVAKGALAIAVLVVLANVATTGGGDLARVRLALTDPAAAYIGSTLRRADVFNYVAIFTAPINILALGLGTYCWGVLGARWRVALVLVFGFMVLTSIGAAVRSGMVAPAVIVSAAGAAAMASRRVRPSMRRTMLAAAVAASALVGFFAYSSFLVEKRISMDMVINPVSLERPDTSNAMYALLPVRWHTSASVTAWYLSHSYARLGRALELPLEGVGLGVANSAFLMRNVTRLTGWDLEQVSYGMRLDRETGSGGFGVFWSTMYAWIASDLTFPGSVLAIFLLGYLLALTWSDVLRRDNALAAAAFACLVFLAFSLPMSNPLQDGPGITTFAGIPALWWLLRERSPAGGEGEAG
jgi:hypothetical protein